MVLDLCARAGRAVMGATHAASARPPPPDSVLFGTVSRTAARCPCRTCDTHDAGHIHCARARPYRQRLTSTSTGTCVVGGGSRFPPSPLQRRGPAPGTKGARSMAAKPTVHVLWINSGLSCDGDSVALTAATQPSIEEIALGALPGLPDVAFHWLLIEPSLGGEEFMKWWWKADRGELENFVLVVEGSIPN